MPYHPQTTSRQIVGRILQQNYVRKWLICYHKWLESSGYIRCYKRWVFWATINLSIRGYPPLVIEPDESKSFLPATIDPLTDELRESFLNVPFDEENSEWEQRDNTDDVDSECNIFDDIIIDDEFIDNPDSTL